MVALTILFIDYSLLPSDYYKNVLHANYKSLLLFDDSIQKMKRRCLSDQQIFSFPPISKPSARILILGSMPGVKSLTDNEYYAHPQNVFWKLLSAIFNEDFDNNYQIKLALIQKHKIALWDVLQSCRRQGSLDANIETNSATANNIPGFLSRHSKITKICFNGQKAHQLFKKNFLVKNPEFTEQYDLVILPSTSPANAGMSKAEKLAIWKRHINNNSMEA